MIRRHDVVAAAAQRRALRIESRSCSSEYAATWTGVERICERPARIVVSFASVQHGVVVARRCRRRCGRSSKSRPAGAPALVEVRPSLVVPSSTAIGAWHFTQKSPSSRSRAGRACSSPRNTGSCRRRTRACCSTTARSDRVALLARFRFQQLLARQRDFVAAGACAQCAEHHEPWPCLAHHRFAPRAIHFRTTHRSPNSSWAPSFGMRKLGSLDSRRCTKILHSGLSGITRARPSVLPSR